LPPWQAYSQGHEGSRTVTLARGRYLRFARRVSSIVDSRCCCSRRSPIGHGAGRPRLRLDISFEQCSQHRWSDVERGADAINLAETYVPLAWSLHVPLPPHPRCFDNAMALIVVALSMAGQQMAFLSEARRIMPAIWLNHTRIARLLSRLLTARVRGPM
jgi:hypothetical protein